jgi:acetoacetyl-CoA synthetase
MLSMVHIAKEKPLWSPIDPSHTQTSLFRQHINAKYSLSLQSYEQLWQWSCTHRATFWSEVWDWETVIGSRGSEPYVDESVPPSASPLWFPGASLNWAENQLRHAVTHPEDVAIIQTSEPCTGWDPPVKRYTQRDLKQLVGQVQKGMKSAGVVKGDRIAFWGGNCTEAVIVLLAASSLGAIFSSAAADFGLDGVKERLEQASRVPLYDADRCRFGPNCFSLPTA